MIKNYLKVALRSLTRNKGFSFINISGLVIGMSTCILICFYILDELSYDTFHKNADSIVRLTEVLHLPKETRHQTVTSPPMAPAVQKNFPEVLKTVRLSQSSRMLSYQDKKFYDTKIWYADSALFDIFTFPMLTGNPKTALVSPYSVVLTEKAAKRYFGDEDALGKTMALSDTVALTVTGVIENIPTNSHIQFDVVLSRSTITHMRQGEPEDNWYNNGTYTYLLLANGYQYKDLEAKMPAMLDKEMGADRKSSIWYDLVLQPLKSIRLHTTSLYDMGPNGNIQYVYLFGIVAALVLMIACANYINLSTAKAMNRSKELGMRKVIGAKRKQLIFQLYGESFLLTFIAFVIAIAVVLAMLPFFNSIAGKQISIMFLLKPEVLFFMFAILVLVGMLAGAYPALVLSSVSPLKVMRQFMKHGRQNNLLRRALVVFQFSLSVMLIAGTMLIVRQMNFMQNQNLGLNKDQIVQVNMRSTVEPHYQLLKNEMSKVAGVEKVTATSFSYGGGTSNIALLPEGANENEITSEATIFVDEDFLQTYEIELLAGRNFSREFPTDEKEAFIVNEAAVKSFNWGTPEDALGKKLDWGLGKKGAVIGVVKDFNFSSLHESIKPLIIHILRDNYSSVSVKINASDVQNTLQRMEEKWKTLNLDGDFEYTFLDEDFKNLYQAEQRVMAIFGWFAGLAILIACLGLFGLAAFTAQQRTKEIGVRKVLGADVFQVVRLLAADFLKPVLIAIVIAIPIAWIYADQWLSGFAYRATLSWWIFASAGLISIGIALFTVSFQSIKAAIANPVDSLRNE